MGAPGRTKLLRSTVGPGLAKSRAGRTGPACEKAEAENGTPEWTGLRTGVGSPEHALPKVGNVNPSLAWLWVDEGASECRGSKIGIDASDWHVLRRNMGAPKCKRSGVGGNEPIWTKLLVKQVEPMATKSETDTMGTQQETP